MEAIIKDPVCQISGALLHIIYLSMTDTGMAMCACKTGTS